MPFDAVKNKDYLKNVQLVLVKINALKSTLGNIESNLVKIETVVLEGAHTERREKTPAIPEKDNGDGTTTPKVPAVFERIDIPEKTIIPINKNTFEAFTDVERTKISETAIAEADKVFVETDKLS